jgi:hypothetical protein
MTASRHRQDSTVSYDAMPWTDAFPIDETLRGVATSSSRQQRATERTAPCPERRTRSTDPHCQRWAPSLGHLSI